MVFNYYECWDWKKQMSVEKESCILHNYIQDKGDFNKTRTMNVWLWDGLIRKIKHYLLIN